MSLDFIIKVCGITSLEDGQFAVDAGANALGFNFFPRSSRYLSVLQASAIAGAVRGSFLRVGVFVNTPIPELLHIAASVPLDVLQLHGEQALVPNTEDYRIWRAVLGEAALPEFDDRIEAYLLDSRTPGHGGSGASFDWKLARGFPYPMIVAGGLDGSNVVQAIETLQPWGVDACSRLEASPGKKDRERVRDFVANARAAIEQQRKLVSL